MKKVLAGIIITLVITTLIGFVTQSATAPEEYYTCSINGEN